MCSANATNIKEEIIGRLKKVSAAALADAMDTLGISSAMDSGIKPLDPGSKIAGPAVTINRIRKPENLGPEDFKEYGGMTLNQTIDSVKPGVVIVIAGQGETESGVWGANMSTRAKAIKVAGVVLDCGTRDSQEIIRMGFPVFTRSIFPRAGMHRLTTIGIDVPVVCGNVLVRPGDLIVGDGDGVVVIPKDHVEEVLNVAEKIEEIDKQSAEYILKGHTLVETKRKFK